MKVIELLFSVDRKQLLDVWNELYQNDFAKDDEAGLNYLARVLQALKDSVPERTTMQVIVESTRAKWLDRNEPEPVWMKGDRASFVDVSGLDSEPRDELDWDGKPYPMNTRWALGFTEWGKWREMEVIQNPRDEPMDPVHMAAHVIEELSWHGLPSSQEERRDDVMDRVEEFHRAMDTGDMSKFHTTLPPPYGCLFIDMKLDCQHEVTCDPKNFITPEEYAKLKNEALHPHQPNGIRSR